MQVSHKCTTTCTTLEGILSFISSTNVWQQNSFYSTREAIEEFNKQVRVALDSTMGKQEMEKEANMIQLQKHLYWPYPTFMSLGCM